MPDSLPNPELLRSLGRLARGLSALFWGLPAALVLSVRAAKAEWVSLLELLFIIILNGLLFFGLWEMGAFQKQERPWRAALDRARILALMNLGLSPFLYWANRVPTQGFFAFVVLVLAATAVLFLFHLNSVIERLGAMLPDETLRLETKQFTSINRGLLLGLLIIAIAHFCLIRMHSLPVFLQLVALSLDRYGVWIMVFLVLLPMAMTMALIWKTKEVILESVFGVGRLPPHSPN
jgi:hypothetical protein